MTKAAKVWAGILLAVVIALIVIVAVGIFMVISLQDADKDRKILLENSRQVDAVVDCIIQGPPPPFKNCVQDHLSTPTTRRT